MWHSYRKTEPCSSNPVMVFPRQSIKATMTINLVAKLHVIHNQAVNYDLCYLGPCHHGMARRRVADGGDGLQIWGVKGKVVPVL
jgi:hypothetical protein